MINVIFLIFFNNNDHWPWLWLRRYWTWPWPRTCCPRTRPWKIITRLVSDSSNLITRWKRLNYVWLTHKEIAKLQKKLEMHSVERMYLQQRCSDGSRWIKPFKTTRQWWMTNTYTWDFPDVIKCRVAALIRYRRKRSGSSIQTIIRIGLKS